MKVILKGIVVEANEGKKGDQVFVNLVDTEQGGMVKLVFPTPFDVRAGSAVSVDCDVRPSISQYGLMLRVIKIYKKGE